MMLTADLVICTHIQHNLYEPLILHCVDSSKSLLGSLHWHSHASCVIKHQQNKTWSAFGKKKCAKESSQKKSCDFEKNWR
jgi:hypothetical protein